jgi:hypothetical protein
MDQLIDILMITYNRPDYTRLALQRLLETCDQRMRVWVWHNGDHEETLDVVRQHLNHPRLHHFHHSHENVRLREPTNWFWKNAQGDLLSKVDDDCLLPAGWGQTLRQAHADVPRFGIIGCWRFLEEDYRPDAAQRKIRSFGGHQLLQNFWVEGSGYLMKRACMESAGLLRPNESFSQYGIRTAARKWINGWYFPFIYQVHMEDPRTPYSAIKSEEDFRRRPSLSSLRFGTPSFAEFCKRATRAAEEVQQASIDLRDYIGWRARLGRLRRRLLGKTRVARFNP